MLGLSQHSMFAQNWNFNWGGIGSGNTAATNSIFKFNFNKLDFSKLKDANFKININLGNFDFSNLNANNCCVEKPLVDISFGYNIEAALAASALIQQALDDGLEKWFNRQHTVLKKEIEKQLGQSFSNYDDARNTYFKYHEKIGIQKNHTSIESKYNARRLDGENKRSISVKNLKLLRLRENELKTGNINNSSYGNFSYNGTSLDQIQSLSQLQSLWRNEYSTFSNVQRSYHNNYYTYLKIKSIGYITNYNDPLVVALFNKQLANYNRYDRWKRLDLMQAYLNEIRPPLALPSGYISPKFYATPQYLENYAVKNRGGGKSVFDDDYVYIVFGNIINSHFELPQIYYNQFFHYAKEQTEKLRNNELNKLLNEVEIKPCAGDPVINPEIVSSGSSGKKGGTFGCTRTDKTTCGGVYGKKNHSGLDVKANVNENAFAMYSGTISSIRNTFSPGKYKGNSYGNFVVITTVINGSTYNIKYNHLNSVSVTQGQTINVGDIIGLTGNTGNAADPDVIPHIHLQVFNSNWSQSLDPEDFLTTKFDSNYNPISNNCQ